MGAQVATRFNTSGQNNVGEDRIWIINNTWKYGAISNYVYGLLEARFPDKTL